MNTYSIGTVILILLCLVLLKCSKKEETLSKPILFIAIKDTAGKNIAGVPVKLYKNQTDPGTIKLSDTTGYAKFYNLDNAIYYWYAEQGCKTNLSSQYTIAYNLVNGAVHYGYSILQETGTLIISNTDTISYKVSDSLSRFNFTIKADTSIIKFPVIGVYKIHSEKTSTPGEGNDTLIHIQCGDTTFLTLPY